MGKVEEIFGFRTQKNAGPGGIVSIHVDCVESRVDTRRTCGYTASEGVIREDVGLVGTALYAAIVLVVSVIGGSCRTYSHADSGDVVSEIVV